MRATQVLGILLLLAVAGCADRTSRDPVSLSAGVDDLPPLVLDFGADGADAPRLLSGWSQPERSPNGETWIWAVGRQASIEVELPHPHYRALALRGWPFVVDGEPSQALRIQVNGNVIGTLELAVHQSLYRLDLPEAAVREGTNVVTFDFRYARSPQDVDPASSDQRRLAVAVDFLRFEAQPRPLFAPGDPSVFFAGRPETLRVELGGEARSALGVQANGELERTLQVRKGARVEVAAALVCPPGARCLGERVFRVEAHHGLFGRDVLWEETLAPEQAWSTARIDLERLADKEIRLVFSVGGTETEDDGALALWGEPLLLEPSRRPPVNVLLVSIDTLRADHLGCYGHERDTSPTLDALAKNGVLFRRAVSQAPWTTPAHMSLLTSLYPSVHRVNQGWSEALGFMLGKSTYRVLSPEVDTMGRVLQRQGYRTYAHTGGSTLSSEFGFAQGFDVYREEPARSFDHLTPEVSSRLLERLRDHRQIPFFLFFQTFEVHAPYSRLRFAEPLLTESQRASLEELFVSEPDHPISALRNRLDELGLLRPEITSALYDGGIRATDDFLSELFAEMRSLGLWERTLIVVTSDHGEEFADHSASRFYDAHCDTLYEEQVHVPLILHLPGVLEGGTVVDEPVELIDVMPTVLDLLGVPAPASMQGRSLRRLIAGETDAARRWILSEATCTDPEMKSIRTGHHKLMTALRATGGERTGLSGEVEWEQLFDLEDDPREQRSLHEADPELLDLLRRALAERFASLPEIGSVEATTEVSGDVLEQLRALGYVE